MKEWIKIGASGLLCSIITFLATSDILSSETITIKIDRSTLLILIILVVNIFYTEFRFRKLEKSLKKKP